MQAPTSLSLPGDFGVVTKNLASENWLGLIEL